MDSVARFRIAVFTALAICMVLQLGCHWPEWVDTISWQRQYQHPLTALNPEEDSVAQIDIATILWRRDQPMLTQGMWEELDEQFLSLEMRKNLARHGLRIGLMRAAAGSRLQAALTNPEYTKESQQQAVDVIQQQIELKGQFINAANATPVCTVEARRVISRSEQDTPWPVGPKGGKALLLVPDAEKEYVARDVTQLEFSYQMQLNKMPDGQTRLRLVPCVKCALAGTEQTNIFLDSLKLKNAVNKFEQRYEKLAVEVLLTQDQYLVVSATRPDRLAPSGEKDPEVWGDLAFVNYKTDQQTVLIFRGASVLGNRTPGAPAKGNAWPLAWQTGELRLGK